MKRNSPKITQWVQATARTEPQFLNTPLISAKKFPESADELAFQRLACIPQMPCPTAISRKSHPLKKSTLL